MPAQKITSAATVEAKTQPWKKQWPPKSKVSAGEGHGVTKGGLLLHEGSSSAAAKYPRDIDNEEA
jgi:hypothetical protein